jgi:hypothetical protein
MTEPNKQEGFRSWAIVEQNGHRTFAGLVSEEIIANVPFVRVDIPRGDQWQTKYLGAGTIFALTPCNEATGRAYSERLGMTVIDGYVNRSQPRLAAAGFEEEDEIDDDDIPI